MSKECNFCKETLEFSSFVKRKDKPNYDDEHIYKYAPNCMGCQSLITKLNYYGITKEEFNSLRVEYKDCCAICGKTEQECRNLKTKHYGLYIDHCHETNKVRGLLCHSCNLVIGHAKDDVNILESAILYLNIVK